MFSLSHQLQKEIKWNIGTLFNNESLAFSSSVDYVSKNVNMLKKKKRLQSASMHRCPWLPAV